MRRRGPRVRRYDIRNCASGEDAIKSVNGHVDLVLDRI